MNMQKKATDPVTPITNFAKAIVDTSAEIISSGAVWLLAAAAGAGVGIGYAGAKMTAHGKQDEDTAKKEYENERLKADLGYLSAKTKSEYQQFKDKQAVKPARVIA